MKSVEVLLLVCLVGFIQDKYFATGSELRTNQDDSNESPMTAPVKIDEFPMPVKGFVKDTEMPSPSPGGDIAMPVRGLLSSAPTYIEQRDKLAGTMAPSESDAPHQYTEEPTPTFTVGSTTARPSSHAPTMAPSESDAPHQYTEVPTHAPTMAPSESDAPHQYTEEPTPTFTVGSTTARPSSHAPTMAPSESTAGRVPTRHPTIRRTPTLSPANNQPTLQPTHHTRPTQRPSEAAAVIGHTDDGGAYSSSEDSAEDTDTDGM